MHLQSAAVVLGGSHRRQSCPRGSLPGPVPDVVGVLGVEVLHQHRHGRLELEACGGRQLEGDLPGVSLGEERAQQRVPGRPHGLREVAEEQVIVLLDEARHVVGHLGGQRGQRPGREWGRVQRLHAHSQSSPASPVQSWREDRGTGKRSGVLGRGPGCCEENWGAEKRTGVLGRGPESWEEV